MSESGARAEDGSPLIAAKWAKRVSIDRRYDVVRCINVERDAKCFADLEHELAPWRDLVTNLQGSFADKLPYVLEEIGEDPAFFFLDPFGVNGIEMDVLAPLIDREGKTELLIHFSDKTFLRMAGHLDENGERLPVGFKLAESKLAKLDSFIGTKRWRLLWARPDVDTEQAIAGTVDLYLGVLRDRGFTYAHQIPIRDHYSDRPSYRLIFCTRSAHGVDLMSDRACRYERQLKDVDDAGARTLFQDDEEREALTHLRDRVYEAGLRRGTASTLELVHELCPELFGRYLRSEYAKVVRELVDRALIDRSSPRGIDERELLRFVEPPQGSLLAL